MEDLASIRRNVASTEGGLRVLIPTNRRLYRLVSYAHVVNFEDAVAAETNADLIDVPLPSRRAHLAALRSGKRLEPVEAPNPEYDLCLFVAMAPYWVSSLRYVRNLRESAKKIVVYLFDAWRSDLHQLRRARRAWSLVDQLLLSFPHSVEDYARHLDCPVHYLPQAVDSERFHPNRTERPIHILSVGRRLPAVHARLLELARKNDLFYHYSDAVAPQAIDLGESQELLARLCQSACIQVCWPVETTNPRRAYEGSVITARWFEAAACGSVVIGLRPRDEEFGRIFPYDDFVREFDPDSPAELEKLVMETLSDSSDSGQRMALAEHVRTNHDWKARWRQIVEICA